MFSLLDHGLDCIASWKESRQLSFGPIKGVGVSVDPNISLTEFIKCRTSLNLKLGHKVTFFTKLKCRALFYSLRLILSKVIRSVPTCSSLSPALKAFHDHCTSARSALKQSGVTLLANLLFKMQTGSCGSKHRLWLAWLSLATTRYRSCGTWPALTSVPLLDFLEDLK